MSSLREISDLSRMVFTPAILKTVREVPSRVLLFGSLRTNIFKRIGAYWKKARSYATSALLLRSHLLSCCIAT
eukprot:2418449-Amphidinium_carterae.1